MSRLLGPRRARIRKANKNNKPRVFNYSSSQDLDAKASGSPAKAPSAGLQKKISVFVNYLIGAAILGGVLYMCVLNPSAQIKVTGEKVYPRERSSYEQGVNDRLKDSIFYRFKPTFDGAKLTAAIKADFPEVNDVDISISPFRHRPIIELGLAKPTAKLVTADKTYILDEEGRALFDEKYASASLNEAALLTINDVSGQNIQLGKPALTQAQISFIREVIGQTKAKGLNPRTFTLSGGGTALDVRFEGLDFFVKFSFYADPKQSSGAFIALYEQLKRDGSLPRQYIDLRVPEKAFVK